MHSIIETDTVVERLAALSPAKRELLLRRLQEAKRTPSGVRPVEQRSLENAYAAPRTLIEEVLVELWASILGRARIGIEDDFFQAGGHSLLATQAVARMREIFDIELPLEALFARPTISAIAAQIEEGQFARQEMPPLTQVPRGGALPLSYTQERIWFLVKLDPTNVAYNVPRVLRLFGELNIAALERAFTEVIRRHEILRTSFPAVDGQPAQIIHPPGPFVIPIVDFSDTPHGEREQAAVRYWQAKGQAPFDLEQAPLLRVELLRFSVSDHALLLTEHHLVHDGWTQGVLMRELITLYGAFSQGQPSPLPEPTIQFADFASWQRRWLEGGVMQRQLDYWRRQLAGAPSLLQLPTQRPRPRLLRSAGALQVLWIPGALADSLRALARREGVTLFMVLVAALDVVLGRCADTEDVCVGSGIANRRHKDAESVLGMILNSVVLRTNLSGNPRFRELLTRVRHVCIGAYANQDVPFSKVVEELQPQRALDRAPLFQIMFSLHDSPAPQLRMPGVEVRLVGFHNRSAKFDLNIIAQASAEQHAGEEANDVRRSIWMGWEYNTDVYDKPTLERVTGYYRNVLEGIVSDPGSRISELPLLGAAERHRILEDWSSPGANYPQNRCLHELFAAQTARTPDAVAVIYEDQHLTYAQLDRRSNQLAHHLRELGVGPEEVVGLCVERSLDMVVGLLGILKAGGAYLPLDPSYPPERLAYMMADAHARVLVTQHTLLPALSGHAAHVARLDADWPSISRHPENAPSSGALPENLAYAIYTSGSTGRPKGVMVTHACVSRLFDATKAWFDFGDHDVWTLFHSYAFDFSVWEIWGALLHGGRVVVVPHWVSRSPEAFHKLLARERVTILNQTPSAFAQLRRVAGRAGTELALRAVIFGGEALRPVDLRPWLSRHGETRPQLVNMYGITETTVHVSYRPLRLEDAEGPAASPIGRGIPDLKVYVLDRHLQPVPIGVCGELYVGGAGLARGYVGRAGLTAERFIPSPFGDGERLYRSGDLARWCGDGELEFIGRIDHQVKLRGYRIELGEVETALRSHADVKDAVVVAREDAPNEKRLVGYVVGRDDAAGPDAAGLREHLKNSLPDYMIPSAFVRLDALPLTPNGKIDRKALPAPDGALVARSAYMAPRTPSEAVLAGIWAEVLKVGKVGVNDNFFELGGHSLLATRVTARIREAFGLELPLRALFEAPTLEGLAATIAAARRDNAGAALPVLAARRRPDRVPLSFAQERLWLLDQLEALGSAYNIAVAVRLQGRLEVAALERSFAELMRRHEVLRTRFTAVDGSPVQLIDPAGAFRLEVEDCSGPAAARRRTAQIVRAPFDLARGPLLRARLLKLSEEEHIAIVVLHHIVSDGWSMGILIGELGALYAAFIADQPSALPELGVQYADYALWQRQWLTGEALARQVGYWKAQLAGAPAALDLPTDRVRPAVQSFKGAVRRFALSAQLTRDLDRLARAEGATPFMVLLAAFQVVLGRWSGQHDVVVGTPIAGRTQRQSEGLIGFFVNTLALRTDLSGDPSFRELVGQVKEAALGAYAHQDLPFEKLVEELQPVRDLSRQPIFQVLFGLQNLPRQRLELPGLQLSRTGSEHVTAKFDLSLQMAEVGSTLRGYVEYAEDLFDRDTIERLVGHLRTLLEGIAADPDRRLSALPLLTAAERHRLITEWNDTAADYPSDKCVHELFAAQAARTPDAVAVVYEDRQLTYGELDRRSNQLAHHLRELGVGPEVVVGVCVERSLDMVVALLGILKAGGAYLPLDPSYPQQRLAYMMADARAPVLLTQARLAEQLPTHHARIVQLDADREDIARQPESAPESEVGPQNLAYVMYTSGSTGQPKGIEVVHYNVGRLVKGANYADLAPENVFLHLAPLAFDASTFEIWGALLNGAELVVYPESIIDISRLKRIIADARVSVLWLTTGLFHRVVDEDLQALSPVKQLLTGGDVLSVPHVRRAIEGLKDVQLTNAYGPTEGTTFSTCSPVAGLNDLAISVPIGRPISNTRLYVLDDGLETVAIGTPGELYIGGAGLARGYLRRAALTAERFVPSPFGDGERLYRTGDLTRWRSDGELEFIGRIDHQVKLRGFRIELGEIEAALRSHAGVKDAVVVAREDAPGEKRLVGYIVGRDDAARPDAAALRAQLKLSLPDYMIPSAFVRLDALPLTPNGKIDRKALPAPEGRPDVGIYEAPRTPTEEVLAGNWCEVLKLDRVGVHDNFFELGGHSLLATRVTARVRQDFGIELPLRALFEAPTLGGLAARIEAARASGACTPLPLLEARSHKDELPLSFAQERLWLLDRLEALGSTFNIPVAVRLQGRLDVMALERSFAELIRRHEVLRTRFTAVDGSPVQVIEPAGSFRLELEDLSVIAANEREAEARRLTSDIANERLDLERGPLFRVMLVRLSVEEHVAVVVMHHVVSDGWSMGILIREIGALYAAFTDDKPSPLPELPVQYADYAIWQRAWLRGKALEQQVAYWKEQLAGAPAALDLPTDRVRPAMQTFKGAAHRFVLSPELMRVLDRLAREEGATLFMVLLAAFQVALARWSGQHDIVVGTPIAGRTQRQSEGLIGFFVNMLALRTDVSEDPSFRKLLRRVKEVALGAYAHQDLPFEKLVEELQPARDLSRQPIFQVLFALQNMPRERLQLPGLQLSRTGSEHVTAKFDLSLYLQEAEHGWGGFVEYATELFERSTIERLTGHFQALLQGIAAEPDCPVSGLPLLGKAERHRLLVEWNDTAADYPSDKCVHELFAAQAARTPDAVAVLYEDQHLTYGELDQRSNQLAHHLRELGVGPEVVVGLCLERSLDMVVGLLGILKAGGAYLPLDPEYPQERLAYMLTDARAPVVVTQAPLTARLTAHPAPLVRLDTQWEDIARQPESIPVSEACPSNLAYLIYTSGSTGKPKGVMIHHGAVVNFLRSMATTPGIDATDVLAAVTPLSFDIAVLEIYLALIAGARIAVIPRDVALDGSRLRQRLETVGATIVQATPATWRMLCEAGWEGGTLKVLCGGDALSLDLARMLAARSAATWNLYGPTEATIWSAAARVVADRPLTIGGPIANTQIHILDARLELMPIGVPGELYLAGVGLARGYFGRPALTAERFLPSPFGNGERLYRTGDLARWRSDGGLEFLGRIDHQVKLRGYRIEPGEIEAVLRQHAGVKDAVVVAGEDSSGEKQLGAYVVVQGAAPDPTELRTYLRKSLPDYMVPSTILPLDALPMTPSGKVDRKALPVPVPGAQSREYLAPRTPTEAALAEIWSDLLAVERVGVDDHFFDLGGHSLLGMRVIERVREAFAVELPLRALFEVPDLRGLAARIDETPLISAESTRAVASGRQQARPWFLSDDDGESARLGA